MAFDGSRAEFYRQSADRIRAIADRYADPEVIEAFERIARQYDMLATEVERGFLAT